MSTKEVPLRQSMPMEMTPMVGVSGPYQSTGSDTTKTAPILQSLATEESGNARLGDADAHLPNPQLDDFVGERVAGQIRKKFQTGMTDDVQRELSQLLSLLPEAAAVIGSSAVFRINTAIEAILATNPQLITAVELKQALRVEIRQRTSIFRAIRQVHRGAWIRLALGEVLVIVAAVCASWLVSRPRISDAHEVTPSKMAIGSHAPPTSGPENLGNVEVRRATAQLVEPLLLVPKPKASKAVKSSVPSSMPLPPTVEVRVKASPQGGDDEFDREFGTYRTKRNPDSVQEESPQAARTVYVPPAPRELPDSLGTGQIMEVVVANKPAILRCASEQKRKDPSIGGRIVMRWSILPTGHTADISCASEEWRSSYIAGCLTKLITDWRFPPHNLASEPINFPFKL